MIIKVEGPVVDVESGSLLFGAGAAGILRRKPGENAALGSVEAGILHSRARVDGDDIEGLGLGSRSSSGGGRERGSEDDVLELHSGGLKAKRDFAG